CCDHGTRHVVTARHTRPAARARPPDTPAGRARRVGVDAVTCARMRWSSVLRALAYLAGAGLFLIVVQVLWGPPAGIVVFGALVGGLTALISLGIALVYRANRILNFAQGDLGFAPASLAVLLIVSSGLSWLAAFVIGIVAAFVVGAVVEFFVIRRFFRA